LPDDLGLLFENQKFSDVTLAVLDEKGEIVWEFQAHKAILAGETPFCLILLFSFFLREEEESAGGVSLIFVNNMKQNGYINDTTTI